MKKNELASRKVWVMPCEKEIFSKNSLCGNLWAECYSSKAKCMKHSNCTCSPKCKPIRTTLKLVL